MLFLNTKPEITEGEMQNKMLMLHEALWKCTVPLLLQSLYGIWKFDHSSKKTAILDQDP